MPDQLSFAESNCWCHGRGGHICTTEQVKPYLLRESSSYGYESRSWNVGVRYYCSNCAERLKRSRTYDLVELER